MSKLKLKVKDVFERKDKKGQESHLITTTISSEGPPCKQCSRNPREAGSSRCAECRGKHTVQRINDRRLQEKITRQIKQNDNE